MLDNYKKIYMIGIGGISMSAIAEYLACKNYEVSGSDRTNSKITDRLKEKNIKVYIGHDGKNLDESIDLVVYTAAIHDDNPEMIRAKELGIEMVNRAKLLAIIMQNYKYSIAIAGSHGKTSVTAMISEILINAKKDPTIFIGGILPSINENFRLGDSQYFVMEACEYCDSFLNFYPYIGVINNVDLDHTDYFKDLAQMEKSFAKFARNVKDDGIIITNENCIEILQGIDKKIITFGQENSNWQAIDIIYDENQCAEFYAVNKDIKLGKIKLNVPGYHNVLNALTAISVAFELKIDESDIKNALENFDGAQRRFELKGFFNNAKVIDDYAHHPNEIKHTIATAKKMHHNKLWFVFQPHTYTRTKKFLNDFAKVLSDVENVILVDIFAAREKNIYGTSSKDLADEINNLGGNAIYLKTFDEAVDYLKEKVDKDDLILTVGAGDVYKIGEKLLSL